jgi:hypothetical protein
MVLHWLSKGVPHYTHNIIILYSSVRRGTSGTLSGTFVVFFVSLLSFFGISKQMHAHYVLQCAIAWLYIHMSVTRWDVTPRNASLGPCATVQWNCFWDDPPWRMSRVATQLHSRQLIRSRNV